MQRVSPLLSAFSTQFKYVEHLDERRFSQDRHNTPKRSIGTIRRINFYNGHSSRSDAIRDALRRYIRHHEWMNDVKGERVGIFEIVYNPVKKGLPATIENILFESNEIFLSSLRVHLNGDYYMRVLVLRGEGEHLVNLAAKLTAQKGVIHMKLTTMNVFE